MTSLESFCSLIQKKFKKFGDDFMQIWVDADACPKAVKEILFRAAKRVSVQLTLVSNQSLKKPSSAFIDAIKVPEGLDIADTKIVELMEEGDLVITADIPLASLAVKKGGYALDPRGKMYTDENIGEKLAVRNLLHDLRNSGMELGGPATFTPKNRQAFSDQLNQFLTKSLNSQKKN